MTTQPSKTLETFANPQVVNGPRHYTIKHMTNEFTCVCPKTGQPDFAEIDIEYIPEELCVELKSLKLYLWSFRNEGHFHEAVTNKILSDLVDVLKPQWMCVTGRFNLRGGIHSDIVATYTRDGQK